MDASRLVGEHKGVVFTICLQVLRHRQDAEDACQEALLKIARRMPDVADPAAWIQRVALRTAIDHRRARLPLRSAAGSRRVDQHFERAQRTRDLTNSLTQPSAPSGRGPDQVRATAVRRTAPRRLQTHPAA